LYQLRELSDGRLIAIGGGAWMMNKDGTNRVPVRSLSNPQWIEPCGRFLLAVTSTNGEKVLTRVAQDGTNETALTSGDILFPACSPDGQSAYYLNAVHPQKIRKISLVDGSIWEIADVLGDTLFGNIVVSPDGKYLAYPYQQSPLRSPLRRPSAPNRLAAVTMKSHAEASQSRVREAATAGYDAHL